MPVSKIVMRFDVCAYHKCALHHQLSLRVSDKLGHGSFKTPTREIQTLRFSRICPQQPISLHSVTTLRFPLLPLQFDSRRVKLSQSTSLSVLFPARGIIGLLDCARGSVWGAWTAFSSVTTWPSHTDRPTYWTVTLHPKPGLSSFQPRLADDRRARVRTRRHANNSAWS